MLANRSAMATFSVAKVTVLYVIVGALLNTSQLSTAFRIFDVDEFPVFEKRSVAMEPVDYDALYGNSLYVNDVGSKATTWSEPDRFYTPLQDDDSEDAVEIAVDDTDADLTSVPFITRRKRYTEYQDNSLAICAGACMYQRRTTYSDCFDMCNWNGRTPSPWKKYDKQHQQEQQQTSYASKVPTHRFGQRKDNQATTVSKSPSGANAAQGRGKITVKPTRPVTPKLTLGKSRTSPMKTNQLTENQPKQQTTIVKGVPPTGKEKNGKTNGVVSKCTR